MVGVEGGIYADRFMVVRISWWIWRKCSRERLGNELSVVSIRLLAVNGLVWP